MEVFAVEYTFCYHEGGPHVLSLHKTKTGAKAAIKKHRSDEQKTYPDDFDLDKTSQRWNISKYRVKEE